MIKLIATTALTLASVGVAPAARPQEPSEPEGQVVIRKLAEPFVIRQGGGADGQPFVIMLQQDGTAAEGQLQIVAPDGNESQVLELLRGSGDERPMTGRRPVRPGANRPGGPADGPDSRVFLDAATRLYAEALRAAEAGQFARAADLARAAEQVARTPGLLRTAGRTQPAPPPGPRGPRARREEIRSRIIERRLGTPRTKDEKRPPEDGRAKPEDDAPAPEQRQIQIRIVPSEEPAQPTEEPPAEPGEAKPGEAEPVVGVGIALGLEDDEFVVLETLEGSPAAESDQIQPGDRLIGVRDAEGTLVKFEGKELGDIVKLIRGPADTGLTLVLKGPDADETKDVALTRRPLATPANAPVEVMEGDPEAAAKPQPGEARDEPADDKVAADEAGPLVGVGLALANEGGRIIVKQVLAASSAGDDGRIKVGDRVVAVERDGETTAVEGEELRTAVERIRGPQGSKVTLVVRTPGSDEDRKVELVRRPLPAFPDASKAEPSGAKETRPAKPDDEGDDDDDDDDDDDEDARTTGIRFAIPHTRLAVQGDVQLQRRPLMVLKRLQQAHLTGPVTVREVAPGQFEIRLTGPDSGTDVPPAAAAPEPSDD